MTSFKIPLLLISGFLGAGKTTFLRNLLPLLGKAGLRPSLIINDYGEAEIDAATLAQLSASLRAINGSCVCCESQDEFLNLLAAEELEPNSVLLVETNGTTDPFEIIESLGLDDRAQRFRNPIHVSIIDTQRWQKRWWHNTLERLQVESASHLFMNKLDLVSLVRADEVLESLHSVNPHAGPISHGSLAGIIGTLRPEPVGLETKPGGDTHRHNHDHEHAALPHSAYDFVSLQIPLPVQISRERMAAWLKTLPREVVRAKGFVRLTEAPDRLHSFQKVEDSVEITFLPLDARFAREPLALLIGSGIARDSLAEP